MTKLQVYSADISLIVQNSLIWYDLQTFSSFNETEQREVSHPAAGTGVTNFYSGSRGDTHHLLETCFLSG